MHNRSIRSRLRLSGMFVPAAVLATLAFAPGAGAATVQPTIYTPTDTPSLQADVSAADNATPGTLSIIQLTSAQYTPTASLPLDGDIEITGPPTLQAPQGSDANVSGSVAYNISPAVPLFEVTSGANVLFKAFDISGGGNGSGVGAVQVDNGGNAEIQNMGLYNSTGNGVYVFTGGHVNMTNTTIASSQNAAFQTDNAAPAGSATLVNDTFETNTSGALSGAGISVYNTLFNKNNAPGPECAATAGDTFAGDYSSDVAYMSCGSTGVTYSSTVSKYTKLSSGYYGGPTVTAPLATGNAAIGAGLAAYCPTADQRFFLYTPAAGKSCDVGAYQTKGTQDMSTSGPLCTIASKNESTNPAVASAETVDATEASGIGLGPDTVNYTITNNGTVGYPTVSTLFNTATLTTWFNATDSGFADPAYESNAAYPVTATKPVGDTTNGDTKWSFYSSDWLGNTSYCN